MFMKIVALIASRIRNFSYSQQVELILPDTLCDQISQAFPLYICSTAKTGGGEDLGVALGGILILPF